MEGNKRRKTNNPTQPYFEDLAEENLEYTESKMQEVYKENRKQLDKMIKFASGIYIAYAVDGKLKLKTSDKKRLQAEFNNRITSIGFKIGNIEEKIVTRTLKEIAENTYNKGNFIIQAGVSKDLSFSRLTSKDIDKIIKHRIERQTYSDRIWKNQAKLLTKLDKQLKESIKKGRSIDKFARDIKKAFAVKTSEARTLARSETGFVQSEISRQVYKDSEAVIEVMWQSELLPNTAPYDASLHGKTWPADGKHPIPVGDTHPNCVCVILPVIKGWTPLKDFDSEYDNWKKAKGL